MQAETESKEQGKRKRRQQAATCADCGKKCGSPQALANHVKKHKKDDNQLQPPLHGISKKRPRSAARSPTTELMNGGHQGQPSLPSTPLTLHDYPVPELINSSALTELMTSCGFTAWPPTPGPGITSSSSSSSSSLPTIYMPSPARSPPLQLAIIGTGTGTSSSTGTGVAEVLCELHYAPEHSTGTQLRLLVSQAHVDTIQPSVTVDGLSSGPILRPWAYLTQCRIKRGQANKAGWVAFFVCDIRWDLLECRNQDQMHRPTRHRLSVTVTNSQDQVIYRHQVKQHRKRRGEKEHSDSDDDDDDDDDNDGNEANEGGEEDAVVLCRECFNRRNRFQYLTSQRRKLEIDYSEEEEEEDDDNDEDEEDEHEEAEEAVDIYGTSASAKLLTRWLGSSSAPTPQRKAHPKLQWVPPLVSASSELDAISAEVLTDVLAGEYADAFEEVVIVDCRHPYQYLAGHIEGAINLPLLESIEDQFPFQKDTPKEKTLVVFYGESSSCSRGPSRLRHLLELDTFPRPCYPHAYLLPGGYQEFSARGQYYQTRSKYCRVLLPPLEVERPAGDALALKQRDPAGAEEEHPVFQLPSLILHRIVTFLDVASCASFAAVSLDWRRVIEGVSWESRYAQSFGGPFPRALQLEDVGSLQEAGSNPTPATPAMWFRAFLWTDSQHRDIVGRYKNTKPVSNPLKGGWSFLQRHNLRENDEIDRTLLKWAAEHGHKVIVANVIRAVGQRAQQFRTSIERYLYGIISWSLLNHAVKYGHEEVVKLLLKEGCFLVDNDDHGETPLLVACQFNRLSIARLLIHHGASSNRLSYFGPTALHEAAARGHLELVELLLDHGWDPNLRSGGYYSPTTTVLDCTVDTNRVDVVRCLLTRGARLDLSSESILHRAARKGSADVVKLLLAHGADTTKRVLVASHCRRPILAYEAASSDEVRRVLREHQSLQGQQPKSRSTSSTDLCTPEDEEPSLADCDFQTRHKRPRRSAKGKQIAEEDSDQVDLTTVGMAPTFW